MNDQEHIQNAYENLHQWILLKIAIGMCFGFSVREDEEFGTFRRKIFDYLSYCSVQAENHLNKYALELASLFPPFSVLEIIDRYENLSLKLNNSFRYGGLGIEDIESPNLLDSNLTPEENAMIKSHFLDHLSYDFLADGMDYSPFRYADTNLISLVDEKTFEKIKKLDTRLLKNIRQQFNAQLQPQLEQISYLPERVLQSANVPDWVDLQNSGMDDRELKRRLSGRLVNPIYFEDVGIQPRHRRRSSVDYETVHEPSVRKPKTLRRY